MIDNPIIWVQNQVKEIQFSFMFAELQAEKFHWNGAKYLKD